MSFNTLAKNTNTRTVARTTPQNRPAGNAPVAQVKNNAGGFVFEISGLQKLDRFLIIGTSGGTFYASEKDITKQNTDEVVKLIKANGKVVVDRVVEISQAGRAKNNDYALLVMALVFTHGDVATKMYAKDKLNLVARTGTHFMHFVAFANGMRGWGRSLKNVVQNWYSSKDTDKLAFQIVKYKQRDGWSHKDIMRLAHVKPGTDPVRQNLYKFINKGAESLSQGDLVPQLLIAAEQAKTADTKTLIKLIQDFKLTHEMIPNEQKNDPKVWEALVPHMGLGALVRNLNKLTAVGLIKPFSETSKIVSAKLHDVEAIRKERLHPMSIVVAQKIYAQGRGDKGSLVWTPARTIVADLEDAFYVSFEAIEPSGKNILLGLDVSGSMSAPISNTPLLSCAEGTAIMAMVTARTEPWTEIRGFTSGANGFKDLGITSKDTLATACGKVRAHNFGGTNCALPFEYALQHKWDVDAVCVYTDNETWSGGQHVFQAVRKYRQGMNKPEAKLITVGMAVNNFSIADPTDRNMLDVVGFDTATPRFISEFIAGNL
jgi:60 kDa SS-A/Ro ribonucleoprotein